MKHLCKDRTRFWALGLLTLLLPGTLAWADEQPAVVTTAKPKIFLFSNDFPSDFVLQHPQPAAKETRFLQLLDKESKNTGVFEFTENLEQAQYRVELTCAGIVSCSRLKVSLMTPHRDVLATYQIPGKSIFTNPLATVAKHLSQTLAERLSLLEEGGVGSYGLIHRPKATPSSIP